MGKYHKIIQRIAQLNDYVNWANQEVQKLQTRFPGVTLKPFAEFKVFLDAMVPKLIHKYMLLSRSMKVCSGISPDFAEYAVNKGFAVLTEKVPGHMRNVILTIDGPYIIDLSYIQFLCQHSIDSDDPTPEEKAKVLQNYKDLYANPFKAIKVEKMPMNAIPHANPPQGNYDSLYDPVKSIDEYNIEESEELFPEVFNRLKS